MEKKKKEIKNNRDNVGAKAEKEAEIIIEDKKDDEISLGEPVVRKSKKKVQTNTKVLVAAVSSAVVLMAVVLTIVFYPKMFPKKAEEPALPPIGESASVNSKLDKDETWQVEIETDNDGKMKTNGAGSLLSLTPSDIKKINLENEYGTLVVHSETPVVERVNETTGKKEKVTDATVYTIEGFEDFDLQPGAAADIAYACSVLSFSSVSSQDASGKLADFGFKKPRAVAKVTYNDGTKAVIKVGATAPKNLGTYVMFGNSKAVFLCDSDVVEHLLFGLNDLMSLTVNDSAPDSDSAEVEILTLSGSAYPDAVTIEPNPNEEIDSDYILTSPVNAYADSYAASLALGGIRGLYAEKVVCVKPSDSQMSKYGLSNPYAKVEAEYPDTTVKLRASKPDSDGKCCLMVEGGKLIYQMNAEKVAWTGLSREKLVSEYLLNVRLTSLNSLTVNGTRFDIDTRTSNAADDDGNVTSTTETAAFCGGKQLDEGIFETMFRNITLLKKKDKKATKPSGSADFEIVFEYSSSRGNDTLAFFKSGDGKHIVTLNGEAIGTVNSSLAEKIPAQAKSVSKNEKVSSF